MPTKMSAVVFSAAALIASTGLSAFVAVRNANGRKVTPASGYRFARMTPADARTFRNNLESGTYKGISPFGAIVVCAKEQGHDWRAVRNAVAKELGLTDGKLGPWNERQNNKDAAVTGLRYAAARLQAKGQ
jgi:hypothetical protein